MLLITIIIIIIVLFGIWYWCFFIGDLQSAPNSEILGTHTKSNNIFHQILVNPKSVCFKNDGILLCFEKVNRARMISIKGKPSSFTVDDQYSIFGIDKGLDCMKSKGLSRSSIKLVQSFMDDPKPIILTHWVETNEKGHDVKYNAYNTIKGMDYNLPKAMLEEYKAVAKLVNSKFKSDDYTHLIFACSGWNNYQDDSTKLYQKWIKHSKKAAFADDNTNNFKPFLIGFTWASSWITPGLSIFNKANDADELGITHVNSLIWKYILPELSNKEIPIITIGHSFGARLMSRANYSGFMLNKNLKTTKVVDKAIDFQGAYPSSRFCEKKGSNGGLYTINSPVLKHFMTCSRFDYAIKIALWSGGYIGNNSSIQKLQRNVVSKNNFEFTSLADTGKLNSYSGQKSKILVDSKEIINKIKSMFSGAHNDVKDKKAGQFIWEVIKS